MSDLHLQRGALARGLVGAEARLDLLPHDLAHACQLLVRQQEWRQQIAHLRSTRKTRILAPPEKIPELGCSLRYEQRRGLKVHCLLAEKAK